MKANNDDERPSPTTICIVWSLIVIPLIVLSILYYRKRKLNRNFLLNDENIVFDEKYMNDRNGSPLKIPGAYCPLEITSSRRLIDSGLIDSGAIMIDWYDEIDELVIHTFNNFKQGLLQSFIFEIFDDIKDFNSPLSKSFFEPRKNHNDGYHGEKPEVLSEKVRNILTVVRDARFIVNSEYSKISDLVVEIATYGALKVFMEDPVEMGKMWKLKDKQSIEMIEVCIYTRFCIPLLIKKVGMFELAKLFYGAISKELNIQITLYDCTPEKPGIIKENCSFTCDNPLKKLSFLIFEDFNYSMRKIK